MKKLLISLPVEPNGSINAWLTRWLLSLQSFRIEGWQVQVDVVQAKPTSAARNLQVRRFLQGDADVIFCIDADQVPTVKGGFDMAGLELLLSGIERDDVDVINGWTLLQGEAGGVPVVDRYVENNRKRLYDEILQLPPDDGPYKLVEGGCGGAMLMFTRHTAETFLANETVWFRDVHRDGCYEGHEIRALLEQHGDSDPAKVVRTLRATAFDRNDFDLKHCGDRITGQDVWFFKQCHRLGLRVWLDTRVFWGHIKNVDLRGEFVRTMVLLKERNQARARNGEARVMEPLVKGAT